MNILPPTENTVSAHHLMSSVAPGRLRQNVFAFSKSIMCSSQPAFAAAVKFHVPKTLAATASDAQIKLLDVFVGRQIVGRPFHHHPAVFQDVAEVGVAQSHRGVLLRQQTDTPSLWFKSLTISKIS